MTGQELYDSVIKRLDDLGHGLSQQFLTLLYRGGIQSRTGLLFGSIINYDVRENYNQLQLHWSLPYYAYYLDKGTKYIKATHFLSPLDNVDQIVAKIVEDITATKIEDAIEDSLTV